MDKQCSKNTKRCDIDPFKKGHKLNDCCRRNLMSIITNIPTILGNTSWWLDFGTLLGFYRDGKIIEHDSDLDVGILYEDFYKNKELIQKMVLDFGFHFERVSDLFYRVNFSNENKLHCDIFLFKKNKNNIYTTHFKEYLSIEDEIFPLGKQVFKNTTFNIPNNVEYFLETRYGKGWITPKSRYDGYKPIKRQLK